MYDFEQDTEEYKKIRAVVDAWGEMMNVLTERIEAIMKRTAIPKNTAKGKHIFEPFMAQYGYWDGRGWWIKEH